MVRKNTINTLKLGTAMALASLAGNTEAQTPRQVEVINENQQELTTPYPRGYGITIGTSYALGNNLSHEFSQNANMVLGISKRIDNLNTQVGAKYTFPFEQIPLGEKTTTTTQHPIQGHTLVINNHRESYLQGNNLEAFIAFQAANNLSLKLSMGGHQRTITDRLQETSHLKREQQDGTYQVSAEHFGPITEIRTQRGGTILGLGIGLTSGPIEGYANLSRVVGMGNEPGGNTTYIGAGIKFFPGALLRD